MWARPGLAVLLILCCIVFYASFNLVSLSDATNVINNIAANQVFATPKTTQYVAESEETTTITQQVSSLVKYVPGATTIQAAVALVPEAELFQDLGNQELGFVRSVPEIAYNHIPKDGSRYFMYVPSGGFNNQRLCLEFAMKISKILKRKLIVPMAGKHLNFWYRYYNETLETLVPMDVLLDLRPALLYGVPMIPLNETVVTVEEKLKRQKRIEVIYTKERYNWKEKDVKTKLKSNKEVLLFKGHTMYHRWFGEKVMDRLHSHMVYNTLFRKVAFQIMKEMGGKFHAIHVRLGDYAAATATRASRAPNMKRLIQNIIKFRGFSPEVPLYIATEPGAKSNTKYWAPVFQIYNHSKVYFAEDFTNIMEQFTNVFYKEKKSKGAIGDFLGLVEQLVCVGAKKFFGSSYSNFSANILSMRKYKKTVFPESVLFWDAIYKAKK